MRDARDERGGGQAQAEIEFFSSAMAGRPDPLEELVSEADRRGIDVSVRTFPPDRFQASVDWLGLTAFALAVLGPVYNDLYQWLKHQVPKLWRTFFDADNPERILAAAITAKGPVPQDHSLAFSVWAEFRYGRVKLVFPEVCSEAVMSETTTKFAKLMYSYALGDTYDGIDLDNEKDCLLWGHRGHLCCGRAKTSRIESFREAQV